MAVTTIEDLRARALIVKNELSAGANSAGRIGSLFEDLLDTLTYSGPTELQISNTIIRFDQNFSIGTLDNPVAGNIPVELTGFADSLAASTLTIVTIFSYSEDGTIPTFLTGWTNLTPGVTYSTTYGNLNTITAQYNGSGIQYSNIVTVDHIYNIEPLTTKGLIWQGFERNLLPLIVPDLSRNPVNGQGNPDFNAWGATLFDQFGNWGGKGSASSPAGVGSTSKPAYVLALGGKINLTYPFTISLWSKTVKADAGTTITLLATVSNTDDDTAGIRLYTVSQTDHKVRCDLNHYITGSSNRRLTSVSALSSTEWKHIWYDYNGTTSRMFINNVLEASQANANNLNVVTSPHFNLSFGCMKHLTTDQRYGGELFLANVRIYQGYIPSDIERTAIFNHGNQLLNPV
jgi:hypothetical protein